MKQFERMLFENVKDWEIWFDECLVLIDEKFLDVFNGVVVIMRSCNDKMVFES